MPTAAYPHDAGLRYADESRPGLARRRAGRGFSYRMPDGSSAPKAVRARVEALAIPPAWTDVWISADPRGHLQATGRDARGRKQYRYHDDWSAHVNRLKFDRMVTFGEALPALRDRVEADLRGRGLTHDRVCALAVRLLDETLIRIGNAEYARTNGTFGLTTLRDEHADVSSAGLTLSFTGKSGKAHALRVGDRRLARLVRACRDLPGHDLFQYLTPDGEQATLGSADVNAYLREASRDDVTAKDFRTWGGTVRAAEALLDAAEGSGDGAAPDPEASVRACVRTVSKALGNTVAVCRRYYIHPDVLDAHRAGTLSGTISEAPPVDGLRPTEAGVLHLLRT